MQNFVHYFLHLGFPLAIAYCCFRPDWRRAYLLLLATMAVDLDHLLASPVFAANRCSIQYHPLHTTYAILGYVGLLFLGRSYRIIGIGLLWHMATDLTDCMMTYRECGECLDGAPALPLLRWLAGWF